MPQGLLVGTILFKLFTQTRGQSAFSASLWMIPSWTERLICWRAKLLLRGTLTAWQKIPKVESSIWGRLASCNRTGWGKWPSAVPSNLNYVIQFTGGLSTSKNNLARSGQPFPPSRSLVLILPIQLPEWLLPFQNIQYENNYPPGTTQLQVITIKVDKGCWVPGRVFSVSTMYDVLQTSAFYQETDCICMVIIVTDGW